MNSVSKLSLVVLLACACNRTTVQPSETPQLAADEGLLAIVMDTDRPVLAVHFVSRDADKQFNLDSAETGTSIQVHRVPAGSYCVRRITWHVARGFNGDRHDRGGILCVDVKPGVLNYPGHMQFGAGEVTWGRSRFRARYDQRTDAYEDLVRAEYPGLVPLLKG